MVDESSSIRAEPPRNLFQNWESVARSVGSRRVKLIFFKPGQSSRTFIRNGKINAADRFPLISTSVHETLLFFTIPSINSTSLLLSNTLWAKFTFRRDRKVLRQSKTSAKFSEVTPQWARKISCRCSGILLELARNLCGSEWMSVIEQDTLTVLTFSGKMDRSLATPFDWSRLNANDSFRNRLDLANAVPMINSRSSRQFGVNPQLSRVREVKQGSSISIFPTRGKPSSEKSLWPMWSSDRHCSGLEVDVTSTVFRASRLVMLMSVHVTLSIVKFGIEGSISASQRRSNSCLKLFQKLWYETVIMQKTRYLYEYREILSRKFIYIEKTDRAITIPIREEKPESAIGLPSKLNCLMLVCKLRARKMQEIRLEHKFSSLA